MPTMKSSTAGKLAMETSSVGLNNAPGPAAGPAPSAIALGRCSWPFEVEMGRVRLKHGAEIVSLPSAALSSLLSLRLWHNIVDVTFHLRGSNNVGSCTSPALWRRQYRLICSAKKLAC